MTLHTKRILVTDTGNDEDDHSRLDRAGIYIYTVHSHAFLQQSKFNFLRCSCSRSFLIGRTYKTFLAVSNVIYDNFIIIIVN